MKAAPQQIVFLTLPENSPSARFRVFQYLDEMKRLNVSPTVRIIPKRFSDRVRLIQSLPAYDVVFLQKRLLQWWWIKYIRWKARVLVYDFDDAVLYRDSHAAHKHSFNRWLRFRNTVKHADLVIAGNDYLSRLAQPYASRISVIPTGVDMRRYVPKPTGGDVLTIGWIGSSPNLMYLEKLVAPINRLYAQSPCFQLKIVCNAFIDGFSCPVVKKVWREEDEVEDIQSFDIGLLPMVDDHWTRGKCALKLLQYMACGLPSVSSDTEFVRGIIEDGRNGYLSDSTEDWFEKLRMLIEDKALRKDLGAAAKRSIEGRFDVPVVAATYVHAIKEAAKEENALPSR